MWPLVDMAGASPLGSHLGLHPLRSVGALQATPTLLGTAHPPMDTALDTTLSGQCDPSPTPLLALSLGVIFP